MEPNTTITENDDAGPVAVDAAAIGDIMDCTSVTVCILDTVETQNRAE